MRLRGVNRQQLAGGNSRGYPAASSAPVLVPAT